MDHPRRPGSPCQRFAKANAESYRASYGEKASEHSGYREFDGWEDGVYVEDGHKPEYCVVRVGHFEVICYRGDVRDMSHG